MSQSSYLLSGNSGVYCKFRCSYHVINSQDGQPRFVAECKNRGFVCDNRDKLYRCIGFNGSGICSHTVAVAKYPGKINGFSGKSSRILTNIAQYGIKSGSGKESGSQRNCKTKPEVLETVTYIQQNSLIKKLKIIRHNYTQVALQQCNKEFLLLV